MQAPGQVQRGPGEGSAKPRGRARSGSTPEKVGEALGQSQVRFNRLPGKVPEKIPEKVEEPSVVVRFNRVPKKVGEKVPETQRQVGFNRVPEKVLEKVPERKLWC